MGRGNFQRKVVKILNCFKVNGRVGVTGLAISFATAGKCHCDSVIPVPMNYISNATSVAALQTSDSEEDNQTIKQKVTEVFLRFLKVIEYLKRLLTYAALGTPALVMAPLAQSIGHLSPTAEDLIWDYCIWAVQALGPTFIKMAQWASTRPDLYPPRLIDRLCKLQDDVQVNYPFSVVEKTLQTAFGDNWREKFDVDPNPIGAGCVAQVFKGILKEKGEKIAVAIKLIHPHVEALVQTDMEILSYIGNWLDQFPSLEMLNLGEVMSDFSDVMRKQLDLRIEAYNLKKFATQFQHDSWALFPKPIEGFVKKNVLVETLMEGSPIGNFMSLKDDISDNVHKLKLKLSDLGCRLILKMIFFDNFIHGDLHPGNLLVQFSPKGEPRLVVLDCGIVFQSKSEADHNKLVEVCMAFMQHDGLKAGSLMISDSKKSDAKRKEKFCKGMQSIVEDCQEQSYFEHMGDYFSKVCDLARDCLVKLDVGYYHIAMALKVAEGISLSLNKDLDIISSCVPIVLKAKALRSLGVTKFPVPEDSDFSKTTAVTPPSRNTNNKK